MKNKKINIGIVGCGNIAEKYLEQINNYNNIQLIGLTDIDIEKAKSFSSLYNCQVYESLDKMLSDVNIDLVVNLTIHHAHAEVIEQILSSGKHVYTEKPLAMNYKDAKRIIELSKKKNLRLSSAPITYMGEMQQTAYKNLTDGLLGKIRLVYAEINHDRIENWHPNPKPFFDVGVLWDVGIYALTLCTALMGSINRVSGYGKVIMPKRRTLDGESFEVITPDFILALLEMNNGALLRLTCNFYANDSKQDHGIEIHGDNGMLYLGSGHDFSSPLEFIKIGGEPSIVPSIRNGYDGTEYARGLKEIADAILNNKPHRASAEHAAHVIEVMEAIDTSVKTNESIDVHSDFKQPPLMDWAR
tara:strand:+ start:21212 stop:22285 length:1074 start_codon:yes stop_codon:yes gene_type:complete